MVRGVGRLEPDDDPLAVHPGQIVAARVLADAVREYRPDDGRAGREETTDSRGGDPPRRRRESARHRAGTPRRAGGGCQPHRLPCTRYADIAAFVGANLRVDAGSVATVKLTWRVDLCLSADLPGIPHICPEYGLQSGRGWHNVASGRPCDSRRSHGSLPETGAEWRPAASASPVTGRGLRCRSVAVAQGTRVRGPVEGDHGSAS